MELWEACATQWRVGFGGPVGLDYNVVFKMAELLEIEINLELMQKLKALEFAFITKNAKAGEK